MSDQYGKLLALLERLETAKIHYKLEHNRDNAIMIIAFAPGEYWEIEFLDDGGIEIERFRSNGEIADESVLPELFALCSDEESSPGDRENADDAIARK